MSENPIHTPNTLSLAELQQQVNELSSTNNFKYYISSIDDRGTCLGGFYSLEVGHLPEEELAMRIGQSRRGDIADAFTTFIKLNPELFKAAQMAVDEYLTSDHYGSSAGIAELETEILIPFLRTMVPILFEHGVDPLDLLR